MKGYNTAKAVALAETKACESCGAPVGHPCVSDKWARNIAPGKVIRYRSTKPHVTRLRAAGVIPTPGATTQEGTTTMATKTKSKATKTKRAKTTKAKSKAKPTSIQRGRGRPKNVEHPGRYQLRHGVDQMVTWLAAAGVKEPGPVLQHWMRTHLDAAATNTKGTAKRARR